MSVYKWKQSMTEEYKDTNEIHGVNIVQQFYSIMPKLINWSLLGNGAADNTYIM
jgi:hypothetical protein